MGLPLPLRLPFAATEWTASTIGSTAGRVLGDRGRPIVGVADGVERLADGTEELVEDGVERVGDAVTGGVGLVGDVIEEGQDLVEDALGLHRRVWEDDHGHAQIEVRGLSQPRAESFRRRVQDAVERLDAVQWAEVNAITERVAVAFDARSDPLAAIVAAVEGVERAHGVARGRRRPAEWDVEDRADHPADAEPAHRAIATLAGNSLALGAAVAGRVVRAPRVPMELAAAVSTLEHLPWVRHGARRVFGKRAVDLALPLLSATANGATQGPFGILVDMAHQASALTEIRSRQRVWQRREPELYAEPSDDPIDPPALEPRPVPIPPGPIEEWSARLPMASLAGAGVTLAATGSPRRSVDTLLAGLPKAARLGREGFAAQLGRTLAARGVVPLDASALRRLDRVDTVVLDSATLLTGRTEIHEIVAVGDRDRVELRRRAETLVRADRVRTRRKRGNWAVAPLDDRYEDAHPLPRGTKARASELIALGCTPLLLEFKGEVEAVVGVAEQLDPAALALLHSVGRAGLRLVLGGRNGRLDRRIEVDGVVPAGRELGRSVRALQAEGAVVAVVAKRGTTGLSAADVGINIARSSGRPSWGGDLLCGSDLTDAAFIIDACVVAAEVSRRSAMFAAGGSALGAAASLGGPPETAGRRALMMVNAAAAASLASGTWAGVELARRPRISMPDPTPWHELEPSEVLATLESSEEGLTDGQARLRKRSRHHTDEHSTIEPFLAELANPLNPVLGAGAALSALTGSMVDAGLVAGLVGVNTVVGGVQRLRTERTISQMLRTHSLMVRVLRDGRESTVDEHDLVRGDILLLGSGDVVPADCRILTASNLEVDESNLTGESLPVSKAPDAVVGAELAERTCMLYDDTSIAAGEATAVVVATGDQTETSRSLASSSDPVDEAAGGVEARLSELSRQVLPFAAGAAAGVVGAGVIRRWPVRDIVGTGVSLAVASVPEGLPFLATAAQLAAARRLSTRGAVVRNPRTIEALGRVDVLCFDKTGTLTEGRVRLQLLSDGAAVERVESAGGDLAEVLAGAARATPEAGDEQATDLIDRAILDVVTGPDAPRVEQPKGWRPTGELPFEANRGLHAVVGRHSGGRLISVKGAPESILPRCRRMRRNGAFVEFDRAEFAAVSEKVDDLAATGYRVLAVAERRAESKSNELPDERVSDLDLLGLLAFSDPVRSSAAEAVRGIRDAGVETVMITGDHPSTARAIASELEMLGPPDPDPGSSTSDSGADHDATSSRLVLTGGELDRLDDDELDSVVERVAVFARVTPAQKVRVVEALRRNGRVVAMTGDGANDAPAIRLADIGVALGRRGSSAAREAADLVVTDDRLETIIDAIAEGRALWGSVREALAILVGGNLGEVGFTLLSSILSRSAPMNPRQFLLVNLMTDLAPALAVAVRPPSGTTPEQLLREGPEASLGSALNRDLTLRAATTAGGASAAWLVARFTGSRPRASTVALVALVGTQLGQTAVAGRRSPVVLATAAGSAAALLAVVQTPGLSQFFGCRPLGPVGWATATGAATTATAVSALASALVDQRADRTAS